mmetsp:Transcript_57667/g.134329  ORF Transcript_57667/g.134329 Transcript_57667/m.134329 type:complete len:211 (-) Transcript_57667:149-781(-)
MPRALNPCAASECPCICSLTLPRPWQCGRRIPSPGVPRRVSMRPRRACGCGPQAPPAVARSPCSRALPSRTNYCRNLLPSCSHPVRRQRNERSCSRQPQALARSSWIPRARGSPGPSHRPDSARLCRVPHGPRRARRPPSAPRYRSRPAWPCNCRTRRHRSAPNHPHHPRRCAGPCHGLQTRWSAHLGLHRQPSDPRPMWSHCVQDVSSP